MFDDEPCPAPAAAPVVGEPLSALSIEELEERITTLQAEIARVETELDSKRAGRAAADAVFGGAP